jgi:hypothetical protein
VDIFVFTPEYVSERPCLSVEPTTYEKVGTFHQSLTSRGERLEVEFNYSIFFFFLSRGWSVFDLRTSHLLDRYS